MVRQHILGKSARTPGTDGADNGLALGIGLVASSARAQAITERVNSKNGTVSIRQNGMNLDARDQNANVTEHLP